MAGARFKVQCCYACPSAIDNGFRVGHRSSMSSIPPVGAGDLLKHKSFLLFLLSRSFSRFASQIGAVAIGWQVYDMTGSAFDLGMIGLVQFLPTALLLFVAGHAADRYERKRVVQLCQIAEGLTALFLAWGAFAGWLLLLLGLCALALILRLGLSATFRPRLLRLCLCSTLAALFRRLLGLRAAFATLILRLGLSAAFRAWLLLLRLCGTLRFALLFRLGALARLALGFSLRHPFLAGLTTLLRGALLLGSATFAARSVSSRHAFFLLRLRRRWCNAEHKRHRAAG